MSKGRWFPGFILIGFGLIFLFNNLGITDIGIGWLFSNFWPIILILIGLRILFDHGGTISAVVGGFILILGFGYLGNNLALFDFSIFWDSFWPIVMILAGFSILFGRRQTRKSKMGFINEIKQGQQEKWELRSGNYSAVLGKVHLDLRDAVIPQGETTINLSAFMGEVVVLVPKNLAVVCEGTCFLGGLEFLGKRSSGVQSSLDAKQKGDASSQQSIRFRCHASFGEIRVVSK